MDLIDQDLFLDRYSEILGLLGLFFMVFGFFLCCGSICVSLYKENKAKRSLFFASDNNNLREQPLPLCDLGIRSTQVSLVQH